MKTSKQGNIYFCVALFYVYECCGCMFMCTICVPTEAQKRHLCLGIEVAGHCETPYMYWEQNLGLLQEQPSAINL